jgi:hypothetical protein
MRSGIILTLISLIGFTLRAGETPRHLRDPQAEIARRKDAGFSDGETRKLNDAL